MPFITQPFFNILSVYRPVQFEVYTLGDANLIPQNAVANLYFKGVLISTFRTKSTGLIPEIVPMMDGYKFCIDVSERIKDSLAPFKSLPSVFVFDCPTEPVNNTDSIGEFYLDITYEVLNLTTGLIEDQIGVNDISDLYYGANITRQDLEAMDLAEFYTAFSRPLTNSPFKINVCREDNVLISYLWSTAPLFNENGFRISLYDSLGALIGQGIGFINSSAGVSEIFTFNVGIENGLKCLILDQQTIGFDLDDPNIKSYTIEIGIYTGGSFVNSRVFFTYELNAACPCCTKRKFRLHWLNLLGGVDSFTFCSIKELKYKSTAVIAEAALPWDKASATPHNPTNPSTFKTRTTNVLKYRVVSQNLSNQTAVWLSEMLGSVKVYLETEAGDLIPVIIEDGEQTIEKETGKRKLELTINLSSCIITQTA